MFMQAYEHHIYTMILDQEKIVRIKKLLKSRPKGLTISDISQILKVNRNSVAKYLEILLITGQVEMRLYGNAKVYYLSQRVPVSSMLQFASELILVLDNEMNVVDINEHFLEFFGLVREDLLGNSVHLIDIEPIKMLVADNLIKEAYTLGELKKDIDFFHNGKEIFFRVKIIPTVFEDGGKGITIIIEDVTLPKRYEKKLRLNEARYRAIVQDQTEMIFRVKPDFTISFINDAVCQQFNKTHEECLDSDLFQYIMEQDRENLRKTLLLLSRENQMNVFESRISGEKGGVRWYQWTNRAIFDENDIMIEYQIVGRDITERKLAEQELLIKDMAIASSINAIGISDLNGYMIYANKSFIELFGYESVEQVLNKPIELFTHNDPDAEKHINDVIRTLHEGKGWFGETIVKKKDGRKIFTQLSSNVVRDAEGNPVRYMASFVDITEQKKAEQELKIKDTAISASINGIAIFSQEKRLIYANNSFISMFELAPIDTIRGKRLWDISHTIAGMSPGLDYIFEETGNHGKWVGEIKSVNENGSPHFAQMAVSSVPDESRKNLSIMLSCVDITDQKLVERALKSTFEKLQDTVEFMPDPTFIVDRNKKVIAWNRALETLTGVKKEVVLGRDDYKKAFSFYRDIRPVLIDILDIPAHELASRYPSIRRFGDGIYVEAFLPELYGGKGAYIWGKASPLIDNDGNVIGAIESVRDISEWKRARESLSKDSGMLKGESRDRVRELEDTIALMRKENESLKSCQYIENWVEKALQHIGEGILVLDPEGKILKNNRVFCNIVQKDDASVRGSNIVTYFAPEETRKILGILERIRDNGSEQADLALICEGCRYPVNAEFEGVTSPGETNEGAVVIFHRKKR
jgi:PAS domain S-box-containing protein